VRSTDLNRRDLMLRGGAGALALAAGWAIVDPAARAASSPSLRQLAAAVKGPVRTPSSSRGLVYNERYASIRPLAVVRAAGAADVQACVRWAAANDVRIVARSGGHSYAGYSTVAGGLVVDLGGLDTVSLSGSTVTAGPGTNLIELYASLARRGATVPGGSCPTVALGGLAQGGGMGLAGRRWGLTCDNITALQIVTADGKLRTANATTNPDLYWACRGGGGGNFGIVTAFQLRARRVSSAAWFFLRFPTGQADAALAAWQRMAPHATSRLTALFTLGPGQVTSLGQFFGSEAQLRSILRPLTSVAGAQLSIGTAGYLSLMQRWAGCAAESVGQCDHFSPVAFDAASDYVAKPLSSSGRAAAIAAARGGTLLFDAYGGAINEVAADATAFVHRDQLFCIQYFSAAASSSWVQASRARMKPHVSGQCYQNYIDPQLQRWRHAYYGSNYARLASIKQAVDPDDLFAFKQSI
jgi:FAD/FMN-containing dehydrogenase